VFKAINIKVDLGVLSGKMYHINRHDKCVYHLLYGYEYYDSASQCIFLVSG